MRPNPEVLRDSGADALTSAAKLLLLESMLRIRRFEENLSDKMVERDSADKAFARDPQGNHPFDDRQRIRTPCHLYIGQEAVAVGACAALKKDDWIWSTHRAHGHYLAKGGNLKGAMAEIFCRATGCAGGRGGSMHLCDPSVGMLGSTAIVGGNIPLGVGAAMAASVQDSDRVSAIFFGDAAMDEGVFWEVLNWAVLYDLPVVFCCENNLYSTHLHIDFRRKQTDLMDYVRPYGLPVVDADGNDVREVLGVTRQAVDRARSGGGPTFLHFRTYRWRGHVGPYDNLEVGLRSPDEIAAWVQRCPIEREKARLFEEGILTKALLDELSGGVEADISEALDGALDAPRPHGEELFNHVFKEGR